MERDDVVRVLAAAETKSAGAEVIVADAEARRVAAELRVIDLESRALRLEEERHVALALLVRVVKYEREDRAVTPGTTRLARVCEEARALLARVGGAP
jgi:hypothetical protein